MKAKILSIRPSVDAQAYTILAEFPDFPAAAGSVQALTFTATLEEYQAWTSPAGVPKTPGTYIEYTYLRPAYSKLQSIHGSLKPLVGQEFDW